MISERADDGRYCPTTQHTYAMEELLRAEKHQKEQWAVMRQLQKYHQKMKNEGLKLWTNVFPLFVVSKFILPVALQMNMLSIIFHEEMLLPAKLFETPWKYKLLQYIQTSGFRV